MKKVIIPSFVILAILILILTIGAVILSFTIIRPATEAINQKLAKNFAKIIYIPQRIPPPIKNFDQTIYFWEMETRENEVIGVRVIHQTGFDGSPNISVTLEMPEKGDPSIFTKVLPAVIADEQSLKSAQDIEKANLAANEKIGYRSIKLTVLPATKQTTKITWDFPKTAFGNDLSQLYAQLARFPLPILRLLYGVPDLILQLLGG